MSVRRTTASWVLSVVAAACAGFAPSPQPTVVQPATSSVPTATASPVTPSPEPFPNDDEFARTIGAATGGDMPGGSDLDLLWERIFELSPVLAGSYRPPARIASYRGGWIPDTTCALGTSPEPWRRNAFYCTDDRTIVYDEAWLREFASSAGPFAPIAILAHEWGHHVQQLRSLHGASIQLELQADCLAGTFLGVTELSDISGYDGDLLAAALKAFFEIGDRDYDASEWFAANVHGSSQQRIFAFGTGYQSAFPVGDPEDRLYGGLQWCDGYRDFMVRDTVEIGPYRLLNLPGRTESWLDDVYSIEPDDRTGYLSSRIQLQWIETLPLAGQGGTKAQLDALLAATRPSMTLLADPIDLDANVQAGSGESQYFVDRISAPDGTTTLESGMIAIVSPRSGSGGLVIRSYRPEPPPEEPLTARGWLVLQDELTGVYELIHRLCGPDQTGDPAGADVSLACRDDQ